jgi:hypothetical protein
MWQQREHFQLMMAISKRAEKHFSVRQFLIIWHFSTFLTFFLPKSHRAARVAHLVPACRCRRPYDELMYIG